MSRIIKEIKYFSGAFALAVIALVVGGLTYESIAAVTGIASHWVAFGFFAVWLLSCNRWNAHLNARLREKRYVASERQQTQT